MEITVKAIDGDLVICGLSIDSTRTNFTNARMRVDKWIVNTD